MESTLINRYERWSYELLILRQPHISVLGLYKSRNNFKILIPNFESLNADDGTPLKDWFHSHKAITSSVELTNEIEPSDLRVDPRSPHELASLAGEPLSRIQVQEELNIRLGSRFPNFVVTDDPPLRGIVTVAEALSDEQSKRLHEALSLLAIPLKWEVEVSPTLENNLIKNSFDVLNIASSRNPSLNGYSSTFKKLLEQDDEFWISEGRNIVSGDYTTAPKFDSFISSLKNHDASLINASTFKPNDIRNHLTLFEKTNVILPLDTFTEDALIGLGVNEKDLIDLLQIGKIRLIMSNGAGRYDKRLLEKVAEACPDGIVFPRMLTAGILRNYRQKFPYLFPQGDLESRSEYLKGLIELENKLPLGFSRSPISAILKFHKENWSSFEATINMRGPNFTLTHGAGAYISSIMSALMGKDHYLEFISADLSLNIASTFGATYFPTEGEGWTDKNHSAILARVYSGGFGNFISDFNERLDTVLDGILSIRKDIPVLELAKSISSGDLPRLKKHVYELAYKKNISVGELKTAVDNMNKEVRAIESRQDRLAKWDILDLSAGVAAGMVTQNPVWGPVVGFIAKRLMSEIPEVRDKFPLAGASLDTLESLWLKTSPDKILFARVNKNLRLKKQC